MYRASNVSVALAGRIILNDVSLELEPGAVTVVIGPNGAGKSTLLRVLSGELAPSSGTVAIDGEDIRSLSPRANARRRAVLPQNSQLAFAFTVAEVVALGVAPEVSGRERDGLVARALAAVDLAAFTGRDCTTLSGGEQQRAQFARVLAQAWSSPKEGHGSAILLDEPTSSLDLSHQLLVLRLARAHAAAAGTVLAILHDLNLAALAADRIVAIAEGRVVADGPGSTVLTAGLLGTLYGLDAATAAIFLPRVDPAAANSVSIPAGFDRGSSPRHSPPSPASYATESVGDKQLLECFRCNDCGSWLHGSARRHP